MNRYHPVQSSIQVERNHAVEGSARKSHFVEGSASKTPCRDFSHKHIILQRYQLETSNPVERD